MNQLCSYKGYAAHIEFSPEDGCFVGHIVDIADIVGFHGETISELQIAFEAAVDDYLEVCDRVGKLPQSESVV